MRKKNGWVLFLKTLTVKAGQSCQWEAMNKKRIYLEKNGSDNLVNK